MSDFVREYRLRADGQKLKVTLRDGLLPDQTAPGLYLVKYDPETQSLTVTRTDKVTTRYAAVNGIENDLDRAAIVMLDKTQATAGLRHDRDPIYFTLFHVPDRSFVREVGLVAAENVGYTTREAKALFTVMKGVSRDPENPLIWSVHSRGADVFNAAIREANRCGQKFANQSVAVFGGAVHNAAILGNLRQAGVGLVGKGFYNHPFDAVPQVVGFNTLNPFKIVGSVLAVPTLLTPASPHTWHPGLTRSDLEAVLEPQWERPGVELAHVPRVTPDQITGLLAADPAQVVKFSSEIDAEVNLVTQRALENAAATTGIEPKLDAMREFVPPVLDPESLGQTPPAPTRIFPAAEPSPGARPKL